MKSSSCPLHYIVPSSPDLSAYVPRESTQVCLSLQTAYPPEGRLPPPTCILPVACCSCCPLPFLQGARSPPRSWESVSQPPVHAPNTRASRYHTASSSGPKGASCPSASTAQPSTRWLPNNARTAVTTPGQPTCSCNDSP